MSEINHMSSEQSLIETAKIELTRDVRLARIQAAQILVSSLIEKNDFFKKEQVVSTEEGREVLSQLVAACLEPLVNA